MYWFRITLVPGAMCVSYPNHHLLLLLLSDYPYQSRILQFAKATRISHDITPSLSGLTNQSGELSRGTQETTTTVAL